MVGCDKPVFAARPYAKSPTFGELVLLFFSVGSGKPIKPCNGLWQTFTITLRYSDIWGQHHGIEQFWRHLKTDLTRLSAMSVYINETTAYGTLGTKDHQLSHDDCNVSRSTRLTFHRLIKLQLSERKGRCCLSSARIFMSQNTQEHS